MFSRTRNQNLNNRARRATVRRACGLALGVVAATFCCSASAIAGPLKTYWTTDARTARTMPPENGGGGWNVGNGVEVPGGEGSVVYIAFRNDPNDAKSKYFHVEFRRLNQENFDVTARWGFRTADTSQLILGDIQIGGGSNGDFVYRDYKWTPQPMWERLEIKNREQNNNRWTLQVDAWSMCANVKPRMPRNLHVERATFGAVGAMGNAQKIKEVWAVPAYGGVNTNASAHAMNAPESSGEWLAEIVFEDPFGNPIPQGGVKWFTNGEGLTEQDEIDLDLCTTDMPNTPLFIFARDADIDQYQMHFIDDLLPPWIEPFDLYQPFVGIAGQRGWTTMLPDPQLDAILQPNVVLSPPLALEVQGPSNVMRPFLIPPQTNGLELHLQTLVPANYQNGQAPQQIILFDQFESDQNNHIALLMGFDSNSQQLNVFCGNGNQPVQVPYIVDQWVPIDVVVDLENDHTAVFYNQQPICEYQWTAGAFGDGNGQPTIAAVDLFAGGSSSVFYDDMMLIPAPQPRAAIIDAAVTAGTKTGGNLFSLEEDDDDTFKTRSGFGSLLTELHKTDLSVWLMPGAEANAGLSIRIADSIDQSTGAARVRLRNKSTGEFDTVGQYALGINEQVHDFNVAEASRYVDDCGVIELQIKHVVHVPFLAFQFNSQIDQVRLTLD